MSTNYSARRAHNDNSGYRNDNIPDCKSHEPDSVSFSAEWLFFNVISAAQQIGVDHGQSILSQIKTMLKGIDPRNTDATFKLTTDQIEALRELSLEIREAQTAQSEVESSVSRPTPTRQRHLHLVDSASL
jgi:hypothetical protein